MRKKKFEWKTPEQFKLYLKGQFIKDIWGLSKKSLKISMKFIKLSKIFSKLDVIFEPSPK